MTNSEYVTLTLKDQSQNSYCYKVKMTTPMGKLMSNHAQRVGQSIKTLRFHFGPRRINEDDTPKTLEIDTEGQIDVFAEQTGGYF